MATVSRAQFKQVYADARRLFDAGQIEEARIRFEALSKLAPKVPEIPFQLGLIALKQRAAAQACAFLETAHHLKPSEMAIQAALADALASAGRTPEALALFDTMISAEPRNIKARANKAQLLQRIGDFDAAEKEFRRALRLAPKDGQLYRLFLATKKLDKTDPLIPAMKAAWHDSKVTGASRHQLAYALAKAMEDTGQTDQVFSYLNAAKRGQRALHPYDVSRRRAEVDALIAAFDGANFDPVSEGPQDVAPIFVTGLPRSGTTLVEHILAAHPTVTAGGEMRHGISLAYDMLGGPEAFTPLQDVSGAALACFAQGYRDAVRAQHDFDRVLTDKSIQTHLVLGLMAKALPSSRMIVVRRDPRDMGLSIYKNAFAEGTHLYSNAMEDIAAYIASFEKILAFWRETIPGRFYEVSYDALVADPEPEIRALVAAAGLEWNDACLAPHKSSRRVETLSLAQVRQPIHARSAKGWEKYAEDLRPLIEALEREGCCEMALEDIRARVAKAEADAGREAGSVQLIAISKVQPLERVAAVLEAGHRVFGENRVQEAQGKWPEFREQFENVTLHLVGPLQSNKARAALELFDAVHTLDRPKLASALARLAQELGHCPSLFVQVNTGEEPQKAGVLPTDADDFIASCRALDLPVVGAMCIPPVDETPSLHFALLAKIAERNGLSQLSMGMSADFDQAIAFGATHVRVGSAIFGVRVPPAGA